MSWKSAPGRLRGSGSSPTSCPTTPPTSTPGSGPPGSPSPPGPGSPERERYVFRPRRGPRRRRAAQQLGLLIRRPRLPDGDWDLHLYAPEQPDLNWQHSDVHAESILRFWFSRGVDGFRIDVTHGLAKDPDLPDLPDLPPLPAPAEG
ncbi:alpha-amylase family glycosyl hydrolase [Streptomyces brasiliscabiei]|uniref:alpha-amylase family glycosyl hydrolase n=1 Tax=Streptomyces brasiliscabiei TaxID=2736302 RepID=UPI001EEBBBF0|nr:alpha-amylase family glycosyl hydrolase [Streptomyces brasiliscabiei]